MYIEHFKERTAHCKSVHMMDLPQMETALASMVQEVNESNNPIRVLSGQSDLLLIPESWWTLAKHDFKKTK